MAKTMDGDIRRLYRRLYDRDDIGVSRAGTILITIVVVVWLLCGLFNYMVLGRDIPRQRDRALLAVAYGPTFAPLDVAHASSTVRLFGKPLPVRHGATLIGGG